MESQKWVTKREMSDILPLGKVEPNMKKPMGGLCGSPMVFLFFMLFRSALTVAMLRSYTIYKLFATNRDPVARLGFLNLQVLV